MHTLDRIWEFRNWILTYEAEQNLVIKRVNDIKIEAQKIGEIWLQ